MSFYVSNREILGMLALEVLEVELDFAHVLVDVVRGGECFAQGDGLCRKIDTSQDDGNVRPLGYVIEAPFPVGIGLAGSFRCDGQMEMLAFLGHTDDRIYQRSLLVAIDGDAAHPSEDRAEWPKEPVLFNHETCITTDGSIKELADE